MDKKEFLDILRQRLNQEVSPDVIEQYISYYETYISSQAFEEEALQKVGDPRLIAKTIIEKDKASKQKERYQENQDSYTANFNKDGFDDIGSGRQEHKKSSFFSNITWYHKLIMLLVVVAIILILAVIWRIIISFLFVFGVPFLILLLLLALFRKR